MIKVFVGGLLVALSAAALSPSAVTAQDGVSNRVSAALGSKNVPPDCKLEGSGDFRVSSAKVYLRTGIEGTGDAINRTNALRNGDRVLKEAITVNGQGKNPAAWYYLGRINLQQGDLAGADSAFKKVEAMAPACNADVRMYRYRVWAALVNAGQTLQQAKQGDSSVVMFRAANQIMAGMPMAYILLAQHFNDAGNADSSIVYFGKAAATEPTAGDTTQLKHRNQAAFNYGVLLLEANRAPDAIVAFRRYLAIQPNDVAAKKGISQAFRKVGQVDSAQVYERQIASAATSGPDAMGAEVSETDLFDIAVKQFTDKDYKAAAETFTRITTQNPSNRDALYNLANAYLALDDGPNLAKTAELLLAIEPLSEQDHKLRVQGYKTAKNSDMLTKSVVTYVALPVNVKVEGLAIGGASSTLTASATGREALDEASKPIPAKPLAMVVEFLGAGGTVVTTTEVPLPALKNGEAHPITAVGSGTGIVGWRYKVK